MPLCRSLWTQMTMFALLEGGNALYCVCSLAGIDEHPRPPTCHAAKSESRMLDPLTRCVWWCIRICRIQRDVAVRGRDVAGVIEQYTKFVKPAFDMYVAPSRKLADIIIPWARCVFGLWSLMQQHQRGQSAVASKWACYGSCF